MDHNSILCLHSTYILYGNLNFYGKSSISIYSDFVSDSYWLYFDIVSKLTN